MNKISKKIVSLVTMAAFALTLVPAAAFAAGPVDAGESSYTATASAVNELKVEATFNGADGTGVDGYTMAQVVVTDVKTAKSLSANSAVTVKGEGLTGNTAANVATLEKGVATGTDETTYTYANVPAGTYNVDVYVQNAAGAAYEKVGTTQTVTVAGVADRSKSVYGAVDEQGDYQATAAVDTYETLTTGFEITDINGYETPAELATVFVWAIDADTNAPTSYFSVEGKAAANASGVEVGNVDNATTLDVQFTQPGTYTLYAGIGDTYEKAKAYPLKGATVVTVSDSTAVDSMELSVGWKADSSVKTPTPITDKDIFKYDKDAKTYTLDLTQVDGFKFNGISQVVLDGKAFNEDGSPALRQTINFTANEPNTVVKLTKATDNTAATGTFHTAFTMESQKNAVITITDEATGVSYDVLVIAQKTSATDIDATKNGGYVLATTDDQWRADVNASLGSAVQFMVTDEKGDAVEGLTTKDFVLNVEDKANKSSLANSNLEVVELGDGLYTLGVREADVQADNKLLTEGKYEVRVALAGVDSENDNIGLTFTAAEFDKIEDVELNVTVNGVELDDQITLGTTADVSLVYVDGNGVKVAGPTDFSWNATNSALAVQSTDNHKLVMKPNTIEHQGVIGSTVTVQAAVPSYGFVDKELTIVSTYNTYSLELDPAEGPVNEYNKVDLNVLNSDGDVAKNINGDIKVVVADSSNEDAKVSVKQAAKVEKGEGALTIYASQETELELVVTVEKAGKILAADTLTYTVGTADPLAGRTVVMTIDSTEYVVNNNIITGDAAPYVDSNWRTMVPIRALAESFDAEVYWNQDDETVTIKFDAGTEIVMTVGEETYTVNGAEATMDTEPVNAGDRVYVPIRFAAEGLGFSVTPLYNDAGLTASVVFQR